MEEARYLAGIFDVRGFVRYDYGKGYHYSINFNFTEHDKKLWENIKKVFDKFFVTKIYKTRRIKGAKEYQLYLGGKKQVYNFLKMILPYTQRKEEVEKYIYLLERKGYNGVLEKEETIL